MNYIKHLFFLFFVVILCAVGFATTSNQHKIDSLKKVLFLKNDDLTIQEEGKILSDIANYYLEIGDVNNSKMYNWRSLKIFYELKNYRNVSKVLLDFGLIELKSNQFDKAIRFCFASQEVLEIAKSEFSDSDYKFYQGMILMNIGIIYEQTKNYNQALSYLHESHENLIKGGVDSTYMAVSHANLGMTYGGLEQFNLAKKHYKKAVTYYGETGLDKYYKAIAYNNLGDAYFEEGNHKKALTYYNKSLSYFRNNDKFLSNHAAVLVSIADNYLELNDVINAGNYLDQAIIVASKEGGGRFIEHIYEFKVKFYTKINNPQLALDNLKVLDEIKDSIYHPKIIANIARYQKDYDFKKIKKENQLKSQYLEQKQLLGMYKWYTFTGVFFVLFLILILLFYRQKHKIRLKNMALKNYKSEQEQLSDKIKFKNNQLTNYAMYIVKKNEFLEGIKEEIDNIKIASKSASDINSLSSLVNLHINSVRDRKEFEIRIEKENQDFYYKLQNNFPNLSEKDKKLCSLLLLELSSKEMAALLNVSVGSVEKSRHRLRKKLSVDSEISLSKFLNNL